MHRARALVVHDLVDETNLEVSDWGNVDAAHPSEVVEMVISGLVGVALEKFVDFLWDKVKKRRPEKEETLKAVTLRRPDGHELVWHFQAEVSADKAASEIQRFVNQLPVERLLGKESPGGTASNAVS
jgi:hypothetical protein